MRERKQESFKTAESRGLPYDSHADAATVPSGKPLSPSHIFQVCRLAAAGTDMRKAERVKVQSPFVINTL